VLHTVDRRRSVHVRFLRFVEGDEQSAPRCVRCEQRFVAEFPYEVSGRLRREFVSVQSLESSEAGCDLGEDLSQLSSNSRPAALFDDRIHPIVDAFRRPRLLAEQVRGDDEPELGEREKLVALRSDTRIVEVNTTGEKRHVLDHIAGQLREDGRVGEVEDRRRQRLLLIQFVEIVLLPREVLLLDDDHRNRPELDALFSRRAHVRSLDAFDLREIQRDCPCEATVETFTDAERLTRASFTSRTDPNRHALELELVRRVENNRVERPRLVRLCLLDDVVENALHVSRVRLPLDRAIRRDQLQDLWRETSTRDRCDEALVDQVEHRHSADVDDSIPVLNADRFERQVALWRDALRRRDKLGAQFRTSCVGYEKPPTGMRLLSGASSG
jgi:hypothetical protein